MSKKQCVACGAINDEINTFCDRCRTAFSTQSSVAGQTSSRVYCETCGSKITNIGALFCGGCGAKLSSKIVAFNHPQAPLDPDVNGGVKVFLYILTLLFSPIGLIAGIVQTNSNNPKNKEFGKGLISFAVTLLVLGALCCCISNGIQGALPELLP